MNNTTPASSSTLPHINQTPSFEKANTGDTATAQIAKITLPGLERTEAQLIERLRLVKSKPSKMGLYRFEKEDSCLQTLGRVALYAITFFSLGLVALGLYSSEFFEKHKIELNRKKLVCEMVDRLDIHVFDIEKQASHILNINCETELPKEKKLSKELIKLDNRELYQKATELLHDLQSKIYKNKNMVNHPQICETLLQIIHESIECDAFRAFLRSAGFLLEDIKSQRTSSWNVKKLCARNKKLTNRLQNQAKTLQTNRKADATNSWTVEKLCARNKELTNRLQNTMQALQTNREMGATSSSAVEKFSEREKALINRINNSSYTPINKNNLRVSVLRRNFEKFLEKERFHI